MTEDTSWQQTDAQAPSVDPFPVSRDTRAIRDVVAVLFIVLGLLSLLAVAFIVDWRLGAASTSVTLIAVGIFLGLDR